MYTRENGYVPGTVRAFEEQMALASRVHPTVPEQPKKTDEPTEPKSGGICEKSEPTTIGEPTSEGGVRASDVYTALTLLAEKRSELADLVLLLLLFG